MAPRDASGSSPAASGGASADEIRSLKLPRRARGRRNGTHNDLWRYTAGDHGYAVTVFEKRGRRSLYVKFWDTKSKRITSQSLLHSDQERAIQQARMLSDAIRLRNPSREAAPDVVTLEYILDTYYREHGARLCGSQPSEHRRRRRLWLGFFANQHRPIVVPADLDEQLLSTFVIQRRHGDIQVSGVRLPAAAPPARRPEKRAAVVKDSTIDADLIYLNAALNWATRYRLAGRRLLPDRPVDVPRVKPTTWHRPMASEEDCTALRAAADTVDPQGLLRYWVDLADGLGWRSTAVSAIKASDIDFKPKPFAPYGTIRKNELVDKERVGGRVPLTRQLAESLRGLLARRGMKAGEDKYLFPSASGDETVPWTRFRVRDLVNAAEEAAGIPHIGGQHALRRKWQTERKDFPATDVAFVSGHKDIRSIYAYRQTDPETTFAVMAQPKKRIRRTDPTTTGATVEESAGVSARGPRRPRPAPTRKHGGSDQGSAARAPTAGVGRGKGSAAHSLMPDGTVVHSRDERFEANLAIARAYAEQHGHLRPSKSERPSGVNLLQWLKNQEIRIKKGTFPLDRRAALEALPAWQERAAAVGHSA